MLFVARPEISSALRATKPKKQCDFRRQAGVEGRPRGDVVLWQSPAAVLGLDGTRLRNCAVDFIQNFDNQQELSQKSVTGANWSYNNCNSGHPREFGNALM